MDISPDRRLREIDAGLWEGLAFDDARALHPREFSVRERDLVGFRFPGGESFLDLRQRVLQAFWEIVDGGGRSVLVVSHKGVNRVLLCELMELPPAELFSLKQEHCCVNLITVSLLADGRRSVKVVGDALEGGLLSDTRDHKR